MQRDEDFYFIFFKVELILYFLKRISIAIIFRENLHLTKVMTFQEEDRMT